MILENEINSTFGLLCTILSPILHYFFGITFRHLSMNMSFLALRSFSNFSFEICHLCLYLDELIRGDDQEHHRHSTLTCYYNFLHLTRRKKYNKPIDGFQFCGCVYHQYKWIFSKFLLWLHGLF